MSVKARREAISRYNKGKVLVLFVSSAGGEGIDLKNTRSVIIMEPHWNNEKIRQVIGRAVRYQSHSSLPEKDRHVDVYNLVLKKPKGEEGLQSADQYLLAISRQKDKKINTFYDILLKTSI
jgi:SNF2 family DNA or RNA helicase